MHPEATAQRTGVVAIFGPPNAGKSTLLNRLVGQKLAIVTPKPQTTRNQISGILTEPGLQIVFVDTPGIHRPSSRMNSMFVQVAWQGIAAADLSLMVCDAHLAVTRPHKFWADLDLVRSRLTTLTSPLILGLNKSDLFSSRAELIPIMDRMHTFFPQAEIVPFSAAREENLDRLLTVITPHLPHGPALYPEDQLSTLPVRFLCTEIVREKLFLQLERELPYFLAVAVEHWDEDPERFLVTMHAVIYVSKSSHKGIVIGKRGARLKEIGRAAREEIEDLLGMQVNLQLWVKVKPGWTEDRHFVQQFVPELET